MVSCTKSNAVSALIDILDCDDELVAMVAMQSLEELAWTQHGASFFLQPRFAEYVREEFNLPAAPLDADLEVLSTEEARISGACDPAQGSLPEICLHE